VKLCVVTSADSNVWISRDPTGGRRTWRRFTVPGVVGPGELGYGDISCPSATLCVGDDAASTNPTAGPAAWRLTGVHSDGISCPSRLLCVAADDAGYIYTSRHPAGEPSSWKRVLVDTYTAAQDPDVVGLSCASASLCVAVDLYGNILTSTHPRGGRQAWRHFNIGGHRELWGVSCPSVTLCAAVDDTGDVWTSTKPAAGLHTWRRALVDVRSTTEP
jgi:hypothetical protein